MPDRISGRSAVRLGTNEQPVPDTLLAASASTGADHPINGDEDLPTLVDNFPMVTPTQFWARHGSL